MAAAEILAIGTGALTSSDVVVASNTAVSLKGHDSGSYVEIQLKDDAAAYRKVGGLTPGAPAGVLTGPGTYRFSRPASSTSCGVFSG